MDVHEIMTTHPRVCHPETHLNEAAWIMWDQDCGVLPVVDDNGRAVGMITDRDICMATTFSGNTPAQLRVADIRLRKPYSCHKEDSLSTALDIMGEAQVRRLPVVDEDERVVGILSVNDILLEGKHGRGKHGLKDGDILQNLKKISEHRDERFHSSYVPQNEGYGVWQ